MSATTTSSSSSSSTSFTLPTKQFPRFDEAALQALLNKLVTSAKIKQEAAEQHLSNLFTFAHQIQQNPALNAKNITLLKQISKQSNKLLNILLKKVEDYNVRVDDKVSTVVGSKVGVVSSQASSMIMSLMRMMGATPERMAEAFEAIPQARDMLVTSTVEAPSPLSSALSRFGSEYSKVKDRVSEYATNPIAKQVFIAGCKKTEMEGVRASRFCSSSLSGDLLAVACASGHKQRQPNLSYMTMDGSNSFDFYPLTLDCPQDVVIDNSRKLLWIASDDRIKAFKIPEKTTASIEEEEDDDEEFEEAEAEPEDTYTLYNPGPSTSMLVSSSHIFGTNLRTKEIRYWNVTNLKADNKLDETPFFDPQDHDLDSDLYNEADTRKGQPCDGVLKVDLPESDGIELIRPLYSSPGKVLLLPEPKYAPVVYDVQQQSVVNFFMGHSAPITYVATPQAIPNIVGTASTNRTAKVWDARTAQCAITLTGHGLCVSAVEIADLNGAPFAFTGGDDECIKVWDLRMTTPLYELSTGNNIVTGLHWHYGSDSLIAVTESLHNDFAWISDDEGSDSESEEEYQWPTQAYHQRKDFKEYFSLQHGAVLKYQFRN